MREARLSHRSKVLVNVDAKTGDQECHFHIGIHGYDVQACCRIHPDDRNFPEFWLLKMKDPPGVQAWRVDF